MPPREDVDSILKAISKHLMFQLYLFNLHRHSSIGHIIIFNIAFPCNQQQQRCIGFRFYFNLIIRRFPQTSCHLLAAVITEQVGSFSLAASIVQTEPNIFLSLSKNAVFSNSS